MTRTARTAFLAWAVITLLIAASLLAIAWHLGAAGFSFYIQQPPLINLPVTLASVALLWVSAGALLWLVQSGRVHRSDALSVSGVFLVLWLYLNILSERFRYGDYQYYLIAATRLFNHRPLPGSYFYPPLWATLTHFLVPLGETGFFLALWLLNIAALLLLYVLLQRTLERYGFTGPLATLVTILFVLVNTPLLRTLVYVQVNLHVLNLILLSLLLYPRRSFLSALALALAVHLKGSPAVLVLAFLIAKDWRWLGWFVVSMLALAGVTLVVNGFSPFLDVLHNLQNLALSENMIFHDTSIDSFLRFTGHLFGLSLGPVRIVVYAVKLLLFGATLAVMARCIRTAAFTRPDERARVVLNALPPLLVFMTIASPVVWEHHGVFLALSFLLLLKTLAKPADGWWFGLAYLLEFLLPTFDFYPWSFGRLLAPLIILWLMWKTAGTTSPPFDAARRWAARSVAEG